MNDPITHVGKDDFYDNDLGLYFEDTWKLRPRLTLNLGVRYDLQHVPQPAQPNTATPLLTLYTSTLNIDKNNIAPRLGVAWQFDRNTVLRAGYGIFYGKTSNSTYYALRVENGVFQQTFSGCGPTSSNPLLRACAPTFPNVSLRRPARRPLLRSRAPWPRRSAFPAARCPASSAAAHGMTPNFVNPQLTKAKCQSNANSPGR